MAENPVGDDCAHVAGRALWAGGKLPDCPGKAGHHQSLLIHSTQLCVHHMQTAPNTEIKELLLSNSLVCGSVIIWG